MKTKAAVESAVQSLGALDGLFAHECSTPHQDRSAIDADSDLLDLLFNVNVRDTANLVKESVKESLCVE